MGQMIAWLYADGLSAFTQECIETRRLHLDLIYLIVQNIVWWTVWESLDGEKIFDFEPLSRVVTAAHFLLNVGLVDSIFVKHISVIELLKCGTSYQQN